MKARKIDKNEELYSRAEARQEERARINRMFEVLWDIKKELVMDKGSGEWGWADKGSIEHLEEYHWGFQSALEALEDAVGPYFSPESRD